MTLRIVLISNFIRYEDWLEIFLHFVLFSSDVRHYDTSTKECYFKSLLFMTALFFQFLSLSFCLSLSYSSVYLPKYDDKYCPNILIRKIWGRGLRLSVNGF